MGAFSSFLVPNFAGPSLAREQHLPLECGEASDQHRRFAPRDEVFHLVPHTERPGT